MGRMDIYNQAINYGFSIFFAGEDWYDNIPQDIWGFIDGTIRPCARPWAESSPGMNLQKEVYSGYKTSHGLNGLSFGFRIMHSKKHKNTNEALGFTE